jgi:hypothetical protein
MRLGAISAALGLAGAFLVLASSAASAGSPDMWQVQETGYCLSGTETTISIQACDPEQRA